MDSNEVFKNFYNFSLWVYSQTDSTYKISLQRQGELLFSYLKDEKKLSEELIASRMIKDMMKLKGRAMPTYLKPYAKGHIIDSKEGSSGFNKRQFTS
jgi:hypothetical protein